MKWVTRERPKTDRIACPWLIRRFIDPEAEFLYVPAERVLEVAEEQGALSFDAPGARYTHRDGLCSFEVLVEEYSIEDPAVRLLARIVHGADIAEERDATPESRGCSRSPRDSTCSSSAITASSSSRSRCTTRCTRGVSARPWSSTPERRRPAHPRDPGDSSVLVRLRERRHRRVAGDVGSLGNRGRDRPRGDARRRGAGLVRARPLRGRGRPPAGVREPPRRHGCRRNSLRAHRLTAGAPVRGPDGTLSTDVVESGPFTSLEQAMLPATAGERDPTRLFGTYNTIATLAGSLGALASAVPALVDGVEQRWLLVYPGLGCTRARRRARPLELGRAALDADGKRRPLRRSRSAVIRLSELFALDSFAGGFVIQAFIAYFFVTKFGTSAGTLGVVFFALGILQAVSFQVAVRLAARFGLLRTMVFTHLPSNVLLAAIAFAPTQGLAIALLLARSLLSQMDVPTRQAYVVALVDPERANRRGRVYERRALRRSPVRSAPHRPACLGRAGRAVRRRRRPEERLRPEPVRPLPRHAHALRFRLGALISRREGWGEWL